MHQTRHREELVARLPICGLVMAALGISFGTTTMLILYIILDQVATSN
jgi:hypothetical protein